MLPSLGQLSSSLKYGFIILSSNFGANHWFHWRLLLMLITAPRIHPRKEADTKSNAPYSE